MKRLAATSFLLLAACATGRDSLSDAAPLPPGTGLVVGKFDFSNVNWKARMGLRRAGHPEVVLAPSTPVFAIPLPPGRYRIEFIDAYRPVGEELFIEVRDGEAVYMGSWYAVLGLDAELRNELAELKPEIERRWGVGALRDGMPGRTRRIVFEIDPLLSDDPTWDYDGGGC